MVRIIKKFLEIILVLLCVAVFAWGVNYLLGFHSRSSTPEPGVNNAVVITASDPIQLLVIYPDERKTGFDTVSGKEVHEITGSKYYFQTPESSGQNGSYWLGLTDNPDSFTLRVIGQPNQYYSFGVYVYRDNKENNRTYWGRFNSSGIASYRIQSSSATDFPLKVSLIN